MLEFSAHLILGPVNDQPGTLRLLPVAVGLCVCLAHIWAKLVLFVNILLYRRMQVHAVTPVCYSSRVNFGSLQFFLPFFLLSADAFPSFAT